MVQAADSNVSDIRWLSFVTYNCEDLFQFSTIFIFLYKRRMIFVENQKGNVSNVNILFETFPEAWNIMKIYQCTIDLAKIRCISNDEKKRVYKSLEIVDFL